MVEGKHKHNPATIMHAVRKVCYLIYGYGLVEWGYFYDERRGSSGGGGREGKTEEFT